MKGATWLLVGEYRLNGGASRASWIIGREGGPKSYGEARAWFRRDLFLEHFDTDDLPLLLGRFGDESIVLEDVRLYRGGGGVVWHRVRS